MALSDYVNTFGQLMLTRHHERVHKLAIDAGFTCPNRDGTSGRGGCTFCNNVSFSPNGRWFLAYFQTHTNTMVCHMFNSINCYTKHP